MRNYLVAAALLGATVSSHAAITILADDFDGHYVELDGSTRQAGVWGDSFTAGARGPSTLSVDLAGNQRNGGPDTVEATFGGARQADVIRQSGLVAAGTPAVSAVPETHTFAMMLAGLACVGLMAGRRERREPPF